MAGAPIRTLIVDDVEGLRRLVTLVLKKNERYEVVGEAADGEQALTKVDELSPDLVLLDLTMPGMDGLEVLEQIHAKAPSTDVIILSGHEAQDMEANVREAGAIGYLEKGLTPEDLVADLDAIVDQAG